MRMAEWVYESLTGMLLDEFRLPWVEDAFEVGSYCANKYNDMLGAYGKINEKLGTDFDDDVEIVINSLLDIQQELCLRMFEYGLLCGQIDKLENRNDCRE